MTRARRLHEIMLEVSKFNRDTDITDMWKNIFKTDDIFEVYCGLKLIHNEIKKLEEEFEVKNIAKTVYKPMIDDMYKLIHFPNFNAKVSNLGRGGVAILPTTLASLSAFGASFGDIEADIDFDDIYEDIEQMEKALNAIDNQDLKTIMQDIIEALYKCEISLKIGGVVGLEEAFKSLFCKVNTSLDEIESTPKEFKHALASIWLKFTNKLESADKALTWIERGEKLLEFLDKL